MQLHASAGRISSKTNLTRILRLVSEKGWVTQPFSSSAHHISPTSQVTLTLQLHLKASHKPKAAIASEYWLIFLAVKSAPREFQIDCSHTLRLRLLPPDSGAFSLSPSEAVSRRIDRHVVAYSRTTFHVLGRTHRIGLQ